MFKINFKFLKGKVSCDSMQEILFLTDSFHYNQRYLKSLVVSQELLSNMQLAANEGGYSMDFEEFEGYDGYEGYEDSSLNTLLLSIYRVQFSVYLLIIRIIKKED